MTVQFKTIYDETFAGLRQAPENATAVFAVQTRQVDGLRSEAALRQFNLTVDEPAALGGTDRGPSPVELVLAALGTCQEITYRLYADALGIPLTGVSVRLTGNLDMRGFFAVDPEVRPGYQSIAATVVLDSPASDADLARLKATVDRHCPVLDILASPTPVELKLERGSAAVQQETWSAA
jgi:uncharacterized OsmC-like protein